MDSLVLDFDAPPRQVERLTPLGATFAADLDAERLGGQAKRVWTLMRDGEFRTLREIEDATGDPSPSVSARLRDFRRMDGVTVEHRREGRGGTWRYRVVIEDYR